MRSQKSRSKRLKRRSRIQRGGAPIYIKKEQIENREYDFEMMSHNDQLYLVIKKTPDHLTDRIGLTITRAYKSSNANININSFTTVDDLKNFALKGKDGPIDIMIETDDRLQANFKEIFIERNAKANAKINDERVSLHWNPSVAHTTMTISPQMPSEGGKHSRKRRRTRRLRKSRRY